MTQYNLLKDCYITTLTSSGTGNLELTQTELLNLYDTNTTSSGISISTTDILYLEISLYRRTRLDGVNVYMSVTGDRADALENINFYYKINDSDEYQITAKSVDSDKFYMNPNLVLFAPKKLEIVISDIDATLYEIELLNYEYNIAFGEDGSMVEKYLYETDTYSTIPIYNNSSTTEPASVYAAIDPASGDMCEYLKISDSADGDYVGVGDAGIGISTGQDYIYTFRMGTFVNTQAAGDGSKVSFIDSTTITSTPYKTASIPITQVAYAGWGVGQNSWDFTADGTIYTIALTSDTTSLYLLRFNSTTHEWYNCGLINTFGNVPDGNASMVILGDYLYIILNLAGAFGRININDTSLFLEMLTTCPHGTLSAKMVQGMCSDREDYIYSAAISSTDELDGVFVRYSVSAGTWSSLNSAFGENNGSTYVVSSRLVLSYDVERDMIYMDCGEWSNSQDCAGFQAYNVSNNTWMVPWRAHTYYYGHAFSYYADYLVYCGYGHAYSITVVNIRTGASTTLTLPYTQDVTALGGNYVYSVQRSRILCYPKEHGRVGVMVAGGPEQKVYYFNLGIDITAYGQGTYTTPIFDMGEQAAAAFFYADRTCPTGTSLTYDGIANYDSMMVRGFDTEPLPFGKFYFTYKPTTSTFALQKRDIIDKTKVTTVSFNASVSPWNTNATTRNIKRILFDEANYDLIFYIYDSNSTGTGLLCRYDLETSTITYVSTALFAFKLTTTEQYTRYLTLDALGTTWLYNGATLYYFNSSMTYTALSSLNVVSSADYIHSLAGSKVAQHCWYTNKALKKLECTDASGTKLLSIALSSPTYLCALTDGGCAVIDDGVSMLYRYNAAGILMASCSIPITYDVIDFKEVLSGGTANSYWLLLANGALVRLYEDGEVFGIVTLPSAKAITSTLAGVVAYSTDIKVTYQVNNDCELIYTWDNNAYTSGLVVGDVVYTPYYALASRQLTYFLNDIEDPVWGTDVDNWIEVKMDNSYFGGKKYYQLKFQFSIGPDTESPTLNKLYFSKAIKLNDIYPGGYKNVYVKTYFPELSEEKEFTADLRCWWTRRES